METSRLRSKTNKNIKSKKKSKITTKKPEIRGKLKTESPYSCGKAQNTPNE